MAALRDGVLLERRFDVATMDVVFILRPPGTDGLAARTSPGSMVVQLGPYPAVIVGTRIQGSASPDEVEGVMNVFQTLDTTGGLGRAIAGEFLPPPVAQPTVDSAASGGAPLAAPIAEPIAAAPTVDDVTTKIDAEAGTTASAVGTEPTPVRVGNSPPEKAVALLTADGKPDIYAIPKDGESADDCIKRILGEHEGYTLKDRL